MTDIKKTLSIMFSAYRNEHSIPQLRNTGHGHQVRFRDATQDFILSGIGYSDRDVPPLKPPVLNDQHIVLVGFRPHGAARYGQRIFSFRGSNPYIDVGIRQQFRIRVGHRAKDFADIPGASRNDRFGKLLHTSRPQSSWSAFPGDFDELA